MATPTVLVSRRPDPRPVPRAPRQARCRHRRRRQRGSCPPAAGLASQTAGPRPRPSLLPAPTCAEFVYLAATATRGGLREGGEKKGRGRGLAAGPSTQRVGGGGEGGSQEVISKERAGGRRQFPGPRERARLRARGEQRRWRAAAAPGAAKCPSPPLRPPTQPPARGQRPWPRAPRAAPRTPRPAPPPSPQIRASAASLTWRRRPPATPATAPAPTAIAAATATAVADAAESKRAQPGHRTYFYSPC